MTTIGVHSHRSGNQPSPQRMATAMTDPVHAVEGRNKDDDIVLPCHREVALALGVEVVLPRRRDCLV